MTVAGDIAGTFNSFFQTDANTVDAQGRPRTAIIFTSSLRSRLNTNNLETQAALEDAAAFAPSENSATGGSAFVQSTAADFAQVDAQILSNNTLPTNYQPTIAMALNPNSMKASQGKRIVEKKRLSGSTFFHFLDPSGRDNDIMRINLAGNTGNIDKRNGEAASQKLLTWHNLYQLTREPKLLGDNSPNVFSFTYISPLFPTSIIFYGFFSKVMEWEENAKKPFSRDYTMEFTVEGTSPDLDKVLDDLTVFLAAANVLPSGNSTQFGS